MRALPFRWIPRGEPFQTSGNDSAGSIPAILEHLVRQRGLPAGVSLDAFLNPRLRDLADPFLIPGMQDAVERILLARRIGEDERVRTAGHVVSLHELIPPDPEQDAVFFRRALRGRSSDLAASTMTGDSFADVGAGFGFEDASPMARRNVTADALQRRGMPMAAPVPAAEAAVSEEMAADPFAAPAPAAAAAPAQE